MDVGGLRWPLLGLCLAYLGVAVVLPVLTIVYASFQRLTTRLAPRGQLHARQLRDRAVARRGALRALEQPAARLRHREPSASLLMGFLSWLIYRSRLPGAGAIEYLLMFPQAVPRLVFAFGMLWAWLVFPIPIYGTLWLLLIAYLTVFLPLGLRTISGVILQIDRSLEESRPDVRRLVGLPAAHRHHAAPPARPGRGVAPALHRERARAGRVDPADGAEGQGHHARPSSSPGSRPARS